MELKPELVDELLKGYQKPEDLIGESGLLKQLTKALIERALSSELTHHLGYEKNAEGNGTDRRNGTSSKTLKGEFGEVEIKVPRDREGSFEPKIVAKHQTRWTGFDDKVLSLYARGMTTREIQGHLQEVYGVEVSPGLISQVTEEVQEEVKAWQSRPLEAVYPIVYLDALYVKDAARRTRGEPGGVRGHRGEHGRAQRSVGVMDQRQRRSQVLADDTDGVAKSGREGHFHRLRGWAEGVSAGDRKRIPASAGAIVHRAPGAGELEIR